MVRISDSNFGFLLELADEYQMDQLRDVCIDYVVNRVTSSIANEERNMCILKYMSVIKRLNLKGISENCEQIFKQTSSEKLLSCCDFNELDANLKLDLVLVRLKYLENAIQKYEKTTAILVSRLYNSMHKAYTEFLIKNGLEESILNVCENADKHTCRQAGHKFDVTCLSCRRKVSLIKQFNVRTSDMVESLKMLTLLSTGK